MLGKGPYSEVRLKIVFDHIIHSEYKRNFHSIWQDSQSVSKTIYSETSIHRFRQGSEKETMDLGAIIEIRFAQGR
jgi:hypothetical protein